MMQIVGFCPGGRRKEREIPTYEGYVGKKKWFVTHPEWLKCGMAVLAPSAQAAISEACRVSGRDFRKIENYSAAQARPMR